jgi:LysM repeat protein
MKRIAFFSIVVISSFLLSGCVVRTYSIARDRVDQDLTGNRGFVTGKTPVMEEEARKDTRPIRVVEMELGWFGIGSKKKAAHAPAAERVPAETEMAPLETAPLESAGTDYQEYKVEKTDTLQKISQKFYGTTKKWKKIFDYNTDTLKTPDKLYPGKTIKIPALDGMKKNQEPVEETASYLK